MARFVPTGNLILCTTGYDGAAVMALWDEVGIPYEWFDAPELRARFPGLDTGRYYPPKRIDDPAFADDADGELTAFYNADSGYIDDPMLAAHNLAHAARPPRCRRSASGQPSSTIGRRAGHVTGVELAGGERSTAPVVVNVGGPHSAVINRMAGVDGDMRIGHRPLRQEVFAVPAPRGFALDDGGPFVADLDIGQYFRPQAGGTLLVGGTEPECDELEWIDDPDDFDEHADRRALGDRRCCASPGGCPSSACRPGRSGWPRCTTPPTTGCRSTTARASPASSWRAARAATSSRTRRSPASSCARSSTPPTPASTTIAEPVQFTGPLTGRTIDLGAFSRRRDPAVTSGTVMG